MASALQHLMNWAKQVEDAHGDLVFMTLDDLFMNGGVGQYEGIPTFQWESGEDRSNIMAIFDHLLQTLGPDYCYQAYMDDDWSDVQYVIENGHRMGSSVWLYDGLYCDKMETIMSVLKKHYNLPC